MVVVCINPLRTLDDVLSPNMSKILNEPGRIVLILDPTLKSDMFILNNEYRKSLELSGLLQNASEGAVGDHPSEAPDLVPLDAPAGFLPATQDALTRRQRDVLYLIVQGRTNKEIARSLGLGEGTVKIHVAALFGKLGVHHRAAVAVAGARFLSEPDSESDGHQLQPTAPRRLAAVVPLLPASGAAARRLGCR